MENQETTKQEVFEYLEELRESGETNMFGAIPYIQEEFMMERKRAKELLIEWMNKGR